MNFHVYPLDEEQLVNKLNAIKVNMLKYNWSKPVWISEVGMHTEQVKTNNTNEIFFKKVVPQALKTLGVKLNGLNYGFIQDVDNKYITLNVDEVKEYMLDKGACPYPVTFAQLKSLNAKEVPVLVATHDESFPSEYFPYILDFVRRGGTVILPYGVPFYYNRTSSGLKSVGEIYAKQLHIGELFWWTDEAKKLKAPETPTIVKPNSKFGYSYTFEFDKKTGRTARYLTEDNLHGKDKMTTITIAGNDSYKGAVAAVYRLNSELKGSIIIQTRVRTVSNFNKENEQARILPRLYLTSFAYGVDKVFWYKFRSCELDSTYSEDNFGVVHKDLSPKPAFYAYKTMTAMCPSGSTRPTLTINGDIYTSTWTKPDGTKVSAIWSPNGTCYTDLPMKGVKIYDYLGKPIRQQRKGKLLITSGVTYLVK